MELVAKAYRGAVVPVLIAVAVLSVISAVLLVLGDEPRTERVSPETMRVVVVSVVAALGAVLPVVVLGSRRVRERALLRVPLVCLGALLAHAVARDALVVVPVQDTISSFAEVLAAVFLLVSLVVLIEERGSGPARSAFSR